MAVSVGPGQRPSPGLPPVTWSTPPAAAAAAAAARQLSNMQKPTERGGGVHGVRTLTHVKCKYGAVHVCIDAVVSHSGFALNAPLIMKTV